MGGPTAVIFLPVFCEDLQGNRDGAFDPMFGCQGHCVWGELQKEVGCQRFVSPLPGDLSGEQVLLSGKGEAAVPRPEATVPASLGHMARGPPSPAGCLPIKALCFLDLAGCLFWRRSLMFLLPASPVSGSLRPESCDRGTVLP